jgi:hypothetical protein
MNTGNLKTAVLKVQYAGFQPVQPVLDRLLETGLQTATIVRGRMTASGAWYEVSVTGTPEAVQVALTGDRKRTERSNRLVPATA